MIFNKIESVSDHHEIGKLFYVYHFKAHVPFKKLEKMNETDLNVYMYEKFTSEFFHELTNVMYHNSLVGDRNIYNMKVSHYDSVIDLIHEDQKMYRYVFKTSIPLNNVEDNIFFKILNPNTLNINELKQNLFESIVVSFKAAIYRQIFKTHRWQTLERILRKEI